MVRGGRVPWVWSQGQATFYVLGTQWETKQKLSSKSPPLVEGKVTVHHGTLGPGCESWFSHVGPLGP